MELKDVFGEIESDGANLVHGRLLEWALTPPLWHADAVGGRPHHQARFVSRLDVSSESQIALRHRAFGTVAIAPSSGYTVLEVLRLWMAAEARCDRPG